MSKKVLILSLGKGIKIAGDYPYKTAKYQFENDDTTYTSPFVATPLISKEMPDYIMIVGTVQSAWAAFYHKFHSESVLDFKKTWNEIEAVSEEYGKDTKDDVIAEYQKRLNKIFNRELQFNEKANTDVQVCLIKYGLNNNELQDTYSRISQSFGEIVDKCENEDIEVTFDITHSFRSLPIYNLVVLNYYRIISNNNVKIKHIYYGNLDVKSENDDIAQIVDLVDIINVLESTRGISEFLNTGNATTFLNCIPEEEKDDFTKSLQAFNEAIQLNERGDIQNSLKKILEFQLVGNKDSLFDSKKVVQEKLREWIPDTGMGNTPEERQRNVAKFQIELAKWFLSLGQIGMAAAIAKESLRSFLVMVYGRPGIYESEEQRKIGEVKLNNKMKADSSNSVFASYKNVESKARKIRNSYAHNLDGIPNEYSFSECNNIIYEYISCIEKIMQMDDLAQKATTKPVRTEKVVIFICGKNESKKRLSDLVKNICKKEDTLICICGVDFKIPDNSKNDKIKKNSKIIGLKIKEYYDRYGAEKIKKIVWDYDIPDSFKVNGKLLIDSLIDSNISSYKLIEENDNQRDIKLDFLWKVDIERDFSTEEQDELQIKADNLRVKTVNRKDDEKTDLSENKKGGPSLGYKLDLSNIQIDV